MENNGKQAKISENALGLIIAYDARKYAETPCFSE